MLFRSPPKWRILQVLSLGPLSFDELRAKAKLRRTGDSFGILLTELLEEKRIGIDAQKRFHVKLSRSSENGVESKQSGRAASLPN